MPKIYSGTSATINLITAAQAVAAARFSNSKPLLPPTVAIGKLDGITLVAFGTAIQSNDGSLYIFGANPLISNADADLSAANHRKIIYRTTVAAADWFAVAGGGSAWFGINPPLDFDPAVGLWFAFWIDAAEAGFDGTTEGLDLIVRYR